MIYRNEDIKARNLIRNSLESRMDASYHFPEELGLKPSSSDNAQRRALQIMASFKKEEILFNSENSTDKSKELRQVVDVNLLEKQNIYAFRERVKNEIYTGERLTLKPEAVKALKDSGIKSVFSLLPRQDDYKKLVKENGLNYMELRDIGNKTLRVLNLDVLEDLAQNPKLYAEKGHKQIEDLKSYVDIMSGKKIKMQYPLYMGCQLGTNRTFKWYSVFQILKDQPKNKPLTPKTLEKLCEFLEIIK